MPNLPISQLTASVSLAGTEPFPVVQDGVTKYSIPQQIRDIDSPLTASGIEVSGDIVPSTALVSSLGSVDKPFGSLFVQSGSISIESDVPGDPSAIISNVAGNLEISVGGMLLVEPGNSFIAETGSFQFISGSLTQVGEYTRVGGTVLTGSFASSGSQTLIGTSQVSGSLDISGSFTINGYKVLATASLSDSTLTFTKTDNETFDIDLSSLAYQGTSNYGLYNQTGSFTGPSASLAEGTLIGGGVGSLTVPANTFRQGDAYRAVISGFGTFHNNDTLDIKVKSNSTILTDTGEFTLTNAGNTRWKMDINFSIHEVGGAGTAVIFSSGIFTYTTDASNDFVAINFGTETTSSFDTTISNTLDITAQFDHDDNVISSRLFTLNKIY